MNKVDVTIAVSEKIDRNFGEGTWNMPKIELSGHIVDLSSLPDFLRGCADRMENLWKESTR